MWVTLALKAQDFMGGLAAADKQAAGFAQRLQGGLGGVLSKLARTAAVGFAGIGAAAVAGFGLLIRSSIQTNAQLETTELQFETLMGSADEAKEHVAGLFEFAKKTPFETGPIIEASKMMRTFGGDVLDTRENLLLVGDASAATNAPINELGFWVGRLYSNLEAGQPFGEAAMRLQELAVMSPQARQEMEALQKSGAGASEIFAVLQGDLGRFTGAMEKQADTWQGLTSTIVDQVQLLAADAFGNFFEAAKAGLRELTELLNDPSITDGIKQLADGVGEAATEILDVVGGISEELAALGFERQNKDIANMIGLTQRQQVEVGRLARAYSNTDLFQFSTGEALAYQKEVLEILQEEYGLVIRQAEGYGQLSEARMEDGRALETYGATAAEVARAAESADRVLLQHAETYQYTAIGVRNTTQQLANYVEFIMRTDYNTKLAADRTDKFADSLAGLTGKVRAVRDELVAAEAAQEAYHAAFMAVQGDYTNQLPGADQPLVTPARDVAITTGGLSPEQVALLAQFQEEARKAQQEIFNLTNGLGTYGLEQEKVNERVLEAQGELEHYQALMAPLAGVVGETSIAHQGLAVNVDAVYQGIYDQLSVMPGAEQAAIAFATATGIMSEAQAEAALQAAAVKLKIEELAGKIAEGMPVEAALTDLDKFIAKITGEVVPAVVTAAADVPAHVVAMKEQMAEEAMLAGAGLMTGLETGMVDNQHLATEAATAAGDEVIRATGAALGVESPSTITHQMGLDLMVGMQNGANEGVGGVVATLTTYGGNIIGGLVAGINAARQSVMNAIQNIADAIPGWLAQFLNMGSPSKRVIPHGRAVPEGMALGVVYGQRTLKTALEKLTGMVVETLDLGGRLSQIGSGFAAEFQRQVTEPMAAELGDLDALLSDAARLFDETMRAAGREDVFADWTDPAQLRTARLQLAELRNVLGGEGDWLGAMQASQALEVLDRRNTLNEEYIRQQERLAALQEAQANLAFLQSQAELVGLIAENAEKLPADMLVGLQFGLEADPGALMDALTAVIEEKAREASRALQESRALGQATTVGLPVKEIQWANETWRTYTDAVKGFAEWLDGRELRINIRIGKLPKWAVPGSPLPIHSTWEEFAEALQGMDFGDALMRYLTRTQAAGDVLYRFLNSLPDAFEDVGGQINGIISQYLDEAQAYFDAVMAGEEDLEDLLAELPFTLRPVIESIGEMMADGTGGIGNYIADLADVGGEINGIILQHLDEFQAYFDAVVAGEGNLSELLAAFPEDVRPVVESIGAMIAAGVEGVEEYVAALIELGEVVESVQETIDLAESVGNLATSFSRHFQRTVLDPLQEQMALTQGTLEGSVNLLAETFRRRFGDGFDFPDLAQMPYQDAINQLLGLRHALVSTQGALGLSEVERAAELAQIDSVLNGLTERNRLQREYEEQQRRILQLEEQRAQLDFLQQQLDLIRLVTESGLDASILAGMQFGLFADAGQLMDTMTRVMQELIRTAQDELQIHSPSRPFREFGQNVMESMALGVSERAGQAWRTLRDELDGVTELNELPINGRQRDTGARGRTIINGGYHVNVYGYDESALEQLQKQASDGRSSGRRLQVPV